MTHLSEHDLAAMLVLLAAGTAMLVLVPKLRIPYPILLVLGGLALGFAPGLPAIDLPPDLVLVGVLPRSSPRCAICARTCGRWGCSPSGSSC